MCCVNVNVFECDVVGFRVEKSQNRECETAKSSLELSIERQPNIS